MKFIWHPIDTSEWKFVHSVCLRAVRNKFSGHIYRISESNMKRTLTGMMKIHTELFVADKYQ